MANPRMARQALHGSCWQRRRILNTVCETAASRRTDGSRINNTPTETKVKAESVKVDNLVYGESMSGRISR